MSFSTDECSVQQFVSFHFSVKWSTAVRRGCKLTFPCSQSSSYPDSIALVWQGVQIFSKRQGMLELVLCTPEAVLYFLSKTGQKQVRVMNLDCRLDTFSNLVKLWQTLWEKDLKHISLVNVCYSLERLSRHWAFCILICRDRVLWNHARSSLQKKRIPIKPFGGANSNKNSSLHMQIHSSQR